MKKLTFTLLSFLILSFVNLQGQDGLEYPLFPGCGEGNANTVIDCSEFKMMQFIYSNLKCPDAAKSANISGEVEAKFTVTVSGDVTNPSVVKGLGHGCDEEVLRLIKMMPKFVPGKENGAAKDMEAFIYVKFNQ